jgi:hypothetical protein
VTSLNNQTIRKTDKAVGYRRKTAVRLCCALTLLLTLYSETYPNNLQERRPTPNQIDKQIKELAREAVREGLGTERGYLLIDKKGKEVSYMEGGFTDDFQLESFSGDPYDEVIAIQLRIEMLRDVFSKSGIEPSYWSPHIRRADTLVRLMIHDIESGREEELAVRTEQFEQIPRDLKKAAERFAKRRRYEFNLDGWGGGEDVDIKVEIVTDPPNGRVRVMPYLHYRKCQILKTSKDRYPWRELLKKTELLVGRYYYSAEWPDGNSDEGIINISDSGTLTFRPRRK